MFWFCFSVHLPVIRLFSQGEIVCRIRELVEWPRPGKCSKTQIISTSDSSACHDAYSGMLQCKDCLTSFISSIFMNRTPGLSLFKPRPRGLK
jgi:hypothetical protein